MNKKAITLIGLLLFSASLLEAQHEKHRPRYSSLTVNAGSDQNIILPAIAILTGSYTVVPAGTNVHFTWSKSSGIGTVTFANAAALSTTATFSGPGNYVLTLKASAGKLSAKSSLTVAVNSNTNGQPPPVPPPPTPGVAKMQWDAVTGATGYNVYRSTQPTSFPSTPLNGSTPLTVTAYSDGTVVSGSTYYYTVRAVNSAGESQNSNVIQYTAP